MSQSINPTSKGGRIVQGDTRFGRYRVEWDRKGNLVSHEIEIREPGDSNPKPTQQPRKTGPCALLKAAIRTLIGEYPCGMCADRCEEMDAKGWAWCAANLKTIAGWLKESADKRAERLEQAAQDARAKADAARSSADAIDPDQALSVLKAAWREMRGSL